MGAITGQSSLIETFQKDWDIWSSFHQHFIQNAHGVPRKKSKGKKKKGVVGQNSRWKGKALAQSRWPRCNATRLCTLPGPKGKVVMNSLFSLLRHLCFKVRLTTQTSKIAALHCCVPSCSNDSRYNKYLSFHALPSDAKTRAEWIVKIRRDRTPNFEVGFDHF